jgi:cystathionine gamma-lyase
MTPVYLTSTYVQKSPGEHTGYEYSRTGNPTRTAMEGCLASLEGAEHGLGFASGCAAASTVMHLFKAGDHLVCGDDLYGGTFRLFDAVWARHDMAYSFVDLSDGQKLREAVQENTRAVWVESPSNPLLKLADIRGLAQVCRELGLLLIVDNTFMSPCFQKPLELGADIVLHSTTKYIGGHSDVVGGFLGTSDDALHEQLRYLQNAVGSIPGPMDCFLTLRGMKTLPIRMERHDTNAMAVARFLEGHAGVERVFYPGLESHPQHALAQEQASGFGGIVTFIIRGGLPGARAFMENTEVFACAESLGGVESLADHPAIMTHAAIPVAQREKLGIVDGLIRLSVGIEHVDDLLADLESALETARAATA